jgi:hypothetical protein
MSDATTITINPAKNSDLEFDVMIQGLDNVDPPIVKFVITSESAGCDYAFRCKRVEGEDTKHRWLAKLPALQHIKESSVKFHVEVIVEGYYFEPAQGSVTLINDPAVKFQPSVSKPKVTTSFTVRQDEDEKPAKKDVKEASGGGEITGQYAPTNGLLKPEFPPPQSHVKVGQAEKDDEHIDHTKLDDIASHVVPGETTDPEPQHGNNVADEVLDDEVNDFDPKRVAEDIVRNTFGTGLTRPQKPGSLFGRRADGSAIVEGLDTPAEKIAKAAKATKVREILKGK